MKKSYISILLLFLVMILAISAVSAADADDTSDSDLQAVDEVASADVDDVVSTDSAADVLADSVVSGKNFTTLQSDIDNAKGYISLQSDYLKESGEGVVTIAKDITINGDNHKIDANKNGGIFKIESGYSVTLMNVILINGNTEKGGAIYNDGSLNFISSQISDSNASVGGAIYNTGILTISSGSTLDGNTATTLGGAVYNEGTAIADQAIFTNNKVTTASHWNPGVNSNGGAAIFTAEGSSLDIDKSTFTGNSAPHDTFAYFTSGGAVYVYRAVATTIDDCTFENNDAGLGGAIVFEGFSQEGIAVQNSVFNSNQAWQGAAINVNEFVGNLNIAGNNFTGNAAVGPGLGGPSAAEAYPASGGAVSIGTMQTTGTTVEITDCDFTQNTAEGGAGAISINANTEVAIENCDFIKNEASYGSAIVSAGTANVNGSRFKENKGNLGTVYLSNSTNSITNSNFTQNDDAWGEILNYAGELTLENNEIDNAGAGIVSWGEGSSIVTNMKVTILGNDTYEICQDTYEITAVITDDAGNIIRDFVTGHFKFVIEGKETVATYDNGVYKATCDIPVGVNLINAIYTEQDELTVETSVIRNIKGTFTDLQAKIDDAIENNSGVLDLTYNFTYNADIDGDWTDGVSWDDSLTINGNAHTISGNNVATIIGLWFADDSVLKNITFINGKSNDYGGAIYTTETSLTINDCTFEDNVATEKGGAIYNEDGTLTITNSVFNNNVVSTGDSYTDSLDDCNGGGAIYTVGGDLTVTGSIFTENTAPHDTEVFSAGGAIYVKDGAALIDDCTFEDNSAVYGGAVMFEGFDQDTVAVKDSRFNDNKAWQGGAINGNDLVSSLIIEGCNFTSNNAVTPNAGQSSPNGGAISVGTKSSNGVSLSVDACNFEENTAVNTGGAISISEGNEATITNSNFTKNSAYVGGAVYNWKSDVDVTSCNFEENTASLFGGAFFGDASTNTISNCNFTNDKDAYDAAIYGMGATLTSSGNNVTGAKIYNNGGTITTPVYVKILTGDVPVVTNADEVTINATVTDDNGNLIDDTTIVFTISKDGSVIDELDLVYDTALGYYKTTYTLPSIGVFTVNASSSKSDIVVSEGYIKNVKGTFTDLQALIDDAGDELILTGDYAYSADIDAANFPDGIIINKNITINGNNHKINGSDANRIFYINYTSTLTLNNATLSDGFSTAYGGAIYIANVGNPLNMGGSLIADHVTFTGNNASAAGAINVQPYGSLYVNECIFEDNEADITNNYAQGGAIKTNSNCDVTIIGSNFTNNVACNQGGAIYLGFSSVVNIEGSKFINNSVVRTAMGSGGALYVGTNTISITGSDFINSNATSRGGAIYISVSNANMQITDSTFIGNDAGSEGGAIYQGSTVSTSITGSTFKDNTNNNVANALFINSGKLYLEGNTINSTYAEIYNKGTITSTINAIVLENKTKDVKDMDVTLTAIVSDDKGNLIYDSSIKFNITGEDSPIATTVGYENYTASYTLPHVGAVYEVAMISTKAGETVTSYNGILRNIKGTYTDLQNLIDDAEGNLVLPYDFAYNAEVDGESFPNGVVISQPIVIDGNGSTISGENSYRIFYINASDVELTDIAFVNGSAVTGGAIYYSLINGNLSVSASVFIDNEATDKGGAIFVWYGLPTIEGSEFYNNTANANGGAICFWRAVGDIDNCYFENNNATRSTGGAVNLAVGGKVTNSVFVDNDAFGTNSALAIGGTDSYVGNCNFTGDYAIQVTGTATLENNKELSAKNVNGYAVYNVGKGLTLIGNKFNSSIMNGKNAKILSEIIVTVLDNKTINTTDDTFELNATITDADGNVIYDKGVLFTVNNESVSDIKYNDTTGLYTATIDIYTGIYNVSMTKYAEAYIKTAVIRNFKGTFTDLQNMINNTAEGTTLVLPYNFTYNAEIDGDALKAGVVINKALTVDGNGSTISGADAARIFQLNANNINIKNTTFTNGYSNTSSTKTADWGGAIYSNAPYSNHVISDCKFYNNTAYNGGAIYLASDASEIVACEFEDNNANASGGAVFIVGLYDTIKDSTFKFNIANELGGAVACYSTQQAAKIKNSVFIGNSAFANGGAVYVNGGAKLNITKSAMENNTAIRGSSIYSNGTIQSFVNATILDNKTWNDTGLCNLYVLNATLTDDMGNNIYDPNFRFTVDGTKIADEPLYYDETGLYTLGYVVEKAGLNVISTSYTADNLEVFTGALDIPIANVTEFTVTVANILDNEDAVVYITLIGANNTKLNETVRVIINNTEIPIVVVNGTGNQTIKNFTHGSYPVVAIFDSNKNYNTAINSTVFYVKATTTIVIEGPTENVTYGEPVTINITVTTSDNIPFDGLITLGYYMTEFNVVINDGKGSYTFDADTYFLSKGEHEFIAVYDGNNDYNASASNRISFNVTAKQLNETDVYVDIDGDAPDKVNVTIFGPKGDYNVTIDGNVYHVEVGEEGIGSIEITGLTAGEKEATIVINDENYNGTITEPFDYRLTPEFDVKFNGTYPNLEITIEGVNGTYTVYVGDLEYQVNITVKDGKATETIKGISAGTYDIVGVSFNGTDLYKVYYRIYEDVVVAQATPVISVVAKEATYPANVIVTVTSDVAGTYTVKVGDKSKEVTLKANVASDVTFEGLDANETGYAINVTYAETENYTATFNDTETVKVFKASAIVTIDPIADTEYGLPIEVTIHLTDSEGKGLNGTVSIKDLPYVTVSIVNGNGTFPIDTQPDVGNYNLTAVFAGDNNYNASESKEVPYNVTNATPAIGVEVVVAIKDYPGVVTVIVTSDVDGKCNITVGTTTTPVEVTKGLGYATFDNIAAGTQNATVTFVADNYAKTTVDKEFTINKATPEFTVVVGEATYPSAVEFTVTGPAGNYTIKVDDAHQTIIEVKDASATGSISGLAAGTYTDIAVNYAESDDYTAASGNVTFTVAPTNSSVVITPVTETITYPGAVNITVTAINGTAVISVKDADGKDVSYTIVDGKVVLTDLAAGNYTVSAVIADSQNITGSHDEITFTVAKATSSVVITPVTETITYPGAVNITVTYENGVPTVEVINANGKEVSFIFDGEKIVLTNLTAGTYLVAAYISDSQNISYSYNVTAFTVQKANLTIVPVVIGDKVVDSPINITFTLPTDVNASNVVAFIDGVGVVQLDVNETTGVYTLALDGFATEGGHIFTVEVKDSNYVGEGEVSFVIEKVEIPVETAVNITIPENTTAPVFSIELPKDATGYLLVDVDGTQYYAPLVNGSASIQTAPLAGGNHTVNVTYTGDDKYAGFSNTTNMTVDSNITADSAFDIPTSTETSSPTFSINLPSDATGYLLVDVDGKKYVAVVENGTASITVPGLSEGNHNVTVSYTGDGKYPALSKDATVNVHIPVYKITENKNINVLYSASASYKVLITKDGKAVGAGETVTIKYNGKTYNVKTDSKGYATLKLSTKVKVKSYTITATYQGVSVKNTVKVKHVIKASNKKVKKSRKVTKIKITLRKVNNKYLAKKTIKVKFKGKTYKVKTNKKGVATWKVKKSMVKKLKVGKKYKYRVTYGKDVLTKKLTIKR